MSSEPDELKRYRIDDRSKAIRNGILAGASPCLPSTVDPRSMLGRILANRWLRVAVAVVLIDVLITWAEISLPQRAQHQSAELTRQTVAAAKTYLAALPTQKKYDVWNATP
jgi:hypothetical protein